MRNNSQICGYFPLFALMLALSLSCQLSAQQRSDTSQARTQEPQPGQQQPTQQPEQNPAQQPSQQQPGQPPEYTPRQPQQQSPGSQASQMQGAQNFTGTIVKSGDKYVFQDSSTGKTYDIDHQDVVSQHVGRKVRVTGTLDPDGKTIRLQPTER